MAISKGHVVSIVHCAYVVGTWLALEGEIQRVEDANQLSVHLSRRIFAKAAATLFQ